MTTPNSIEQGETFTFDTGLSGDDETGFAVNINVMQYPGDTPAISRALTHDGTDFVGVLTSVETAALAVGQWFIHITASDSNENIREPVKFYVEKGWT